LPVSLAFCALALALGLLAAIGGHAHLHRRPLRRLAPIAALILLIVTAGYVAGCAGGFPQLQMFNPNVTPAGTFTITVTATSGTDVHTTTVTLIVE
jgi:hypothetical protein